MIPLGTLLLPTLLSAPLALAQIQVEAGVDVNVGSSSKVAAAWFAGWHTNTTPAYTLDNVPWEKYTKLTYSFAETTPDGALDMSGSNETLLPDFIARAKENGVTPAVSIGGWAGSRFFSSAVATAENRTAFVKTVLDFATEYELEAIDFDWEYPNNQGLGCNTINANDTANFLAFLQELRADDFGATLELSAATAISPFMNADGEPSEDVSAFAEVFDYIAIMNYDLWGTWSTSVGPNAPLNDSCAAPENQQGSAVSAVEAWSAAGMPLDQIVLGVASYGHSFGVNKTAAMNGTDSLVLYPAFNATAFPAGDAWDDEPSVDACGVQENQGGVIQFWGLVEQGYLGTDGQPAEGVPYVFDECSQTNFVYNSTTEVLISYDSAEAFTAKGAFIKDMGLRGFATWEAGGDYQDILLDAIRQASGF
ncbi:glycoside hydrolase family 18 protein [Schizophyllum amplum]|uniref:Glycoside hydrolase family 18 protein n=1 Tax=Schizophyllum amplum TaxID=97359 RepID=A0A550CFX6_9AGAR|nr:glycoside hydrolase family 18 protein [Auriculariopsis ampla]